MSENITQQTYKISTNIEAMKTTLSAVSEIVEEATFNLESDGLRFYSMDPGHICLLDIFQERGKSILFDHEFKFAVDPKEFLKELKKFKVGRWNYESLKLELFGLNFGAQEDRYMIIKYKDQSARIELKEVMPSSIPKPKFQVTSKLVLPHDSVKAIKALESFSDGVTFEVSKLPAIFKVKTKSDHVMHLEAEIFFSTCESEIQEDTSSSYGTDYLNKFLKVYLKATEENSTDLTVELGNKLPLKASFKVDINHSTLSNIIYYLAPRIIE